MLCYQMEIPSREKRFVSFLLTFVFLLELVYLKFIKSTKCSLGVKKLNGKSIVHETGRHRIAFFYWLGTRSNIKKQSRCMFRKIFKVNYILGALALRNFDKEKHEHVRVEQGQEPLMFLHLFCGMMIVKGI